MIGIGAGIGLGLNTPIGGSGESDPALPAVSSGTLVFHVKANIGRFDADVGGSAVNTDGVAVGRWEDQSGGAHHLIQATAANRPLYKTNIFGTRGAILFDGVNDKFVSVTQIVTGAFTAFSVVKLTGTAGILYEVADGDLTAAFNGFWLFASTNHSIIARNAPAGNASAWDVTANWGVDNQPKMITHRMDGTHLGHQLWIDRNLQVLTPKIAVSPGTGTEANTINYAGRFNNANPCTGYFAETIIYNGALSTTDRQNVENYLRDKWGTP
jgi:hypothetical protein